MIIIIIQHTGERNLYFFDKPYHNQPNFSVTLNADETREIGAQLLGVNDQSGDVEKAKAFHHQMRIKMIELKKGSPLLNQGIADSHIREQTGVSVVGLIKGDEVIATPDANEVLQVKNTIIAMGKREQINGLVSLCSKGSQP